MHIGQPPPDFVLWTVAGAVVANDGELDGARLVRPPDLLGRRQNGGTEGQDNERARRRVTVRTE